MDNGAKSVGTSDQSESPPLIRLASRLQRTIDILENGVGQVISAGHRLADRMGGDEPPVSRAAVARELDKNVGLDGQIGELEQCIVKAEALAVDLYDRADAMMVRLAKLG